MLKMGKSLICGQGCFTTTALSKRRKIAEYAGELVRGQRNIEARVIEQQQRGVIKIVWIAEDVAIDGEDRGNETAYINHSCEPNAFARRAPGNRMLFFALRDIEAGEEITIDYIDPIHPTAEECRCGARACSSTKNRRSKAKD
jgi:hypothetical protein